MKSNDIKCHDTLPAGCCILRIELLFVDCLPVLVHHEHADRDQRGGAEDAECHRDDLEDKPPPASPGRGFSFVLAGGVGLLGGGLVVGRCVHRDRGFSFGFGFGFGLSLGFGFGFLRLATQPDRPGLRARRGGDRLGLGRLGLSLLGQRQRVVRRHVRRRR